MNSKISPISKTDPEKPQHRNVLYVEGIPESTKQAFKAKCALKKEAMRDAIIKLMRQYAEQV